MVSAYNASNIQNSSYQQQRGSIPMSGAIGLGGVCGGAAGYYLNRHPVTNNGTVSESFAKKVFLKHVNKNLSSDNKKFFKQLQNILKNLPKVKTSGDLTKLLEKNKQLFNTQQNGIAFSDILKTINSDNVKAKKEVLSKNLQSWLDLNIKNMEDCIRMCWDNEEKKFVNKNNINSKMFKVIKSTGNSNVVRKAAASAGLGGCVAAGLALLYNKFFA